MAKVLAGRLLPRIRDAVRDPLYRGSLVLLINTGLLAIGGFAFWGLAAHAYSPGTVGTFAGLTAGIGLVSTGAALGVPNTITRHLSRAPNQQALVWASLATVTALGGVLSVIVVLALGPHLPSSLHLQQRGNSLLLFTGLVILTALNGAISAALVVHRATTAVLWTNLVGSVARLIALVALSSMRSSGLILAFSIGLFLSTTLALPPLIGKLAGHGGGGNPVRLLRGYIAGTLGNYVATIFGMLPSTVVPLEALAARGAAQTAPLTIAFLVVGFLNFIPSTGSQVMFAEASRRDADAGRQARKAIRTIYALLVPAVAILVAAAPLILRAFGASYAAQGTSCLRILALTTVITAGNYLIDSTLLAVDRVRAYLFMNAINAVLVLGCVGVLLSRGLSGGAEGWALAQALSLLLGLTVVAAGRPKEAQGATSSTDVADLADEPPLRARIPAELRTTLPLLLGPVSNAEEPLRVLSRRLARVPVAGLPRPPLAPPGEAMLGGIWYPPVTIFCGLGEVRPSRQLPVLVVISAYSGWIEARLMPTCQAPDMFAGCWQAFQRFGGIPRVLEMETGALATQFQWFCQAIGVAAAPADASAQGLLRGAYARLERAFGARQAVLSSPAQLRWDIAKFLALYNADPADAHSGGPGPRIAAGPAPVKLAPADQQRMRPLPAQPAGTTWRIEATVGRRPQVCFDGNNYSVPLAAIGRQVTIIADLGTVRLLCDGELVANHPRSWSLGATVIDPDHEPPTAFQYEPAEAGHDNHDNSLQNGTAD